jgi:hypothetical protein
MKMHDLALLIVFAVFTFCAYVFKMGWFRSIEAADTKDRLVFQYRLTEAYVSQDDLSFVGLDFEGRKIVLGAGIRDAVYGFAKIAYVKVIENEIAQTVTNRGNRTLEVVVEGRAIGNVHTPVSPHACSSGCGARIQRLALEVFVDDGVSHLYTVSFFRSRKRKGVDPAHSRVNAAREQMDLVYAQVLRALRQENADTVASPSGSSLSASSLLPEMKQKVASAGEEFAL